MLVSVVGWCLLGLTLFILVPQDVLERPKLLGKVRSLANLVAQKRGCEVKSLWGVLPSNYCPQHKHTIVWYYGKLVSTYQSSVLEALSRRTASNLNALHVRVSENVVRIRPFDDIDTHNDSTSICEPVIRYYIVNSMTESGLSMVSPSTGECVIYLHMNNEDEYSERDTDAIYQAMAHSVSCVRALVGISPDTRALDVTTEGEQALDPNVFITSGDIKAYRRRALATILRETQDKLAQIVQLYSLDGTWGSVWALSGDLLSQLAEIEQLYSDLLASLHTEQPERTVARGSGSSDPTERRVCAAQDSDESPTFRQLELARSLHKRVTDLLTEPVYGKQEPQPLEQLFAVYGPYWLPLLVPVLRALRMWLKPSKGDSAR